MLRLPLRRIAAPWQLMRVVRCAHHVKRTFGEALVEIGDVMSGIVVIIDGEVRRVRRETNDRLAPATSAPRLGSPTSALGLGPPLPHLCRDWAHPGHICTGTGAH